MLARDGRTLPAHHPLLRRVQLTPNFSDSPSQPPLVRYKRGHLAFVASIRDPSNPYISGTVHQQPTQEMSGPILKVAITQAEPEWLDLAGSVEKTIKLITEAAKGGAKLVAFPEVWICGYPGWIW